MRRKRASAIASARFRTRPQASVPNIEPPLNMSLTPAVDPVAAPLLGQHTKDVLARDARL